MSRIDLIENNWVELVFEGRNQAYGAYKLRKETSKRNLLSLCVMAIAAIIIAVIVGVNSVIKANQAKVAVTTDVELSKLAEKKEAKVEKKEQVKIEEVKPVEKVKSSIKFTAPVIKKDEEVKPEEEMQAQDDLQKTTTSIGAFNVEGNDEAEGQVLQAKEEIAQPEPPKNVEENKVFTTVEQMPSFPGGDAALMQWLRNNVRYPAVAEENGIQGRVVVSFVVEKNGSITDVQVVKSVDPSLDREAARVVKAMPNWVPGKQNGSAVRVKYNVPVTFRLQQ